MINMTRPAASRGWDTCKVPYHSSRPVRGLNDNHNRDLKNLFKSAAISASTRPGPLRDFYLARVEKGMRPTMARLTLARKMAAISLTVWKKGVEFAPQPLQRQAAISEEQAFPLLRFTPLVGGRVLQMLGSRVSISQ